MRKILVLLFLFPMFAFTQNPSDTIKYWTGSGVFTTNLSQVSLTNWAAGGQSSMSGEVLLNYLARYKKDSLSWDNYIDMQFGFLKEGKNDFTKSSDRMELNSKVGYATAKNWNYAGSVNFKSQFAPGYFYPRTPNDSPISEFLAPAYINIALGMDYKKDWLTLFLAPLSTKFTIVANDSLSAAGEFGVDPGSKFRGEFGASARLGIKKEIAKNVTFQTKVDLFTNYAENFGNIDVDWTMMFNLKVNEWLAANLLTHLIYDDDIKILNEETGRKSPMVQFMQTFGVGITFKF